MASAATDRQLIELVPGANRISAVDWNRCAGGANPFTRHEFFDAMEASGSAAAATGWQPAHLCLRRAGGDIGGILPAYVKGHSQGEYVFDHSWADALERTGAAYYPKYQISVPFTPATGPRVLAASQEDAALLIRGAEAVARQNALSSVHATFISPEQVYLFEAAGWLIRHGEQFHWFNPGYESFEDFLAVLASRKRKAIRRERRKAAEHGLDIIRLSGNEIEEAHLDAFWDFYQDTGARKWGTPYLTRQAFSLLVETMAERLVLILALDGTRPLAGALNMLGEDAIYGRYWGTLADLPFVHFELCYYQAIEIAIERGLARVEAGAQGPHKLARGYEPVTTYSAHWFVHPGLRTAVADFIERERLVVGRDIDVMRALGPFRKK